MKLTYQKLDTYTPLSKLIKFYDHKKTQTILFESKAYHEQNYTSYLVVGTLFKIEIVNEKFLFICFAQAGYDLISSFINAAKLNVIEKNGQRIQIEFKAKNKFNSQKAMVENHPYFNIIKALITHLTNRLALPNEFIFPMLFSYDLIDQFYAIPQYENKQIPDFQFYMPQSLYIENKIDRVIDLYTFGEVSESKYMVYEAVCPIEINNLHVDISEETYIKNIKRCKEFIENGEVYQLVYSRTFSLECRNPLLAYEHLREINPSPYMFYINDFGTYLFGASPERSVQYNAETREVLTSPIAGTKPRAFKTDGKVNNDSDNKRALELKLDQKEIAEHLMLVDLARNDISSISVPGSRTVKRLMEIETYSHVLHLVSEVSGKLLYNLDAFNAYQALMNMGTLTGSPKFRAYQLIRELEGKPRGYYGGSVGFISVKGDLNTAIIIRSAYVKDANAYISAGAGIVYDSKALLECDESKSKAKAVIIAIEKSAKKAVKHEQYV